MSTEITPESLKTELEVEDLGDRVLLHTYGHAYLTNDQLVELVDCLVRWQIKNGYVKL